MNSVFCHEVAKQLCKIAIGACFILIGCNRSQYPVKPKTQTPREILQAVKKRYHTHSKLEVHAFRIARMIIKGAKYQYGLNDSAYFARKLPRKMRFETKNAKDKKWNNLLISDGNTVWHYSSLLNAYTENKYAVSKEEDAQIEKEFKKMKVKKFMRAFNPLADSIQKITALGPDTLIMPDSSRHKALKIKVKYAADSATSDGGLKKMGAVYMKILPTLYWIDPQTSTVLCEKFGILFGTKRKSKKGFTWKSGDLFDIFYTSVNLHPSFGDSTFAFQPPNGAARVKDLNNYNKKLDHHKKSSK
jgi:outer membrane lipoprotein-sorting protein